MIDSYIVDKRKEKHCPKCKGKFLSFKVNNMPANTTLDIECNDCQYTFSAQRESDHHEFKKESQEFNS